MDIEGLVATYLPETLPNIDKLILTKHGQSFLHHLRKSHPVLQAHPYPKQKVNCLPSLRQTILLAVSFSLFSTHKTTIHFSDPCLNSSLCHPFRNTIQMIINILSLAVKHPNSIPDPALIPRDPRTIIQRANFDVQFSKKICCRVCYKLYDVHPSTPQRCDYKPFTNSDPCDEELFVNKKIYQGNKDISDLAYHFKPPDFPPSVVGTPRCVFLSQSILTWMTWLLSKPDYEKAIDDWVQTNQDLKDQGYFSDIQHGEVFMNTKWKNKPHMLKLGLSLFVDWFNPRGNKISGKVQSTGVLALSCLNLPPTFRNKLSHMCIAGITPGPYSPDPHSFNHLLTPIVDKLIKLDTGIIIPTYRFPAGRFVQIKLLCVYGDVLATKKVVGYASHSATKFCSFCHAIQANIPKLQLATRREKAETIHSAHNSKNTKSETARNDLLKETGVRWSELNRPAYWDPSRRVVLGIMHNWLEGILQGHFRFRWRFGSVSADKAKKRRQSGLRLEAGSSKRARMDIAESAMWINDEDPSDESDNDEDILLDGGAGGSFFSLDDIVQFRTVMSHIILPLGVPHLPQNLGEAKHGKLSASQWHALFVFIVPLVLCEMYVDEVGKLDLNSNRYRVLANTAHLVACTNVAFA
jgi:hypothetical protein